MNEILCTSEASGYAEQIMGSNYEKIISNLENAKNEITLNWEGDTADINDLITRIDLAINTFKNKIDPGVSQLAQAVYNLASVLKEVSSADVKSGAAKSTSMQEKNSKNSKPGFWEYHAQDFANDWDYSGCDGFIDGLGATLNGVISTSGSIINFAVDGTGELIKGAVNVGGDILEGIVDFGGDIVNGIADVGGDILDFLGFDHFFG